MLFNPAMIPDSITTFEQLGLWVGQVNSFMMDGKTYKEVEATVADVGFRPVVDVAEKITPPGESIIVHRIRYVMNKDYKSLVYNGDWEAVQEVITDPAPVNYLNPNYVAS